MSERTLMTQERTIPLEPSLGFEPRYDLPPEECDVLLARLIVERGIGEHKEDNQKPSRFVCYELHPCDEITNAARTLEERVFREAFANDVAVMKNEYDDFETGSRFFVIVDLYAPTEGGDFTRPKLVGSIRATQSKDLMRLKTLHDISLRKLFKEGTVEPKEGEDAPEDQLVANIPLDEVTRQYGITADNTWDVGTLAVLKEYRGLEHRLLPSTMLYRSMFMAARRHGIDNIVAIFDKKPLGELKLMGVDMPPICGLEPVSYAGSASSVFVRLNAETALANCEAMHRAYEAQPGRTNKFLAELSGRLALGTGVDKNTVPLSSMLDTVVTLEEAA